MSSVMPKPQKFVIASLLAAAFLFIGIVITYEVSDSEVWRLIQGSVFLLLSLVVLAAITAGLIALVKRLWP